MFKQNFHSINTYGYFMHVSPPASNLCILLNISHFFKKNSKEEQGFETDILLGLTMINARRFIQATQILSKVSKYFLKKYQQTLKKQSIVISKYNKKQNQMFSITKSKDSSISNIFFFNSSNYPNMSSNKKYLLRAAKIQLLIADALNHPSMINQKIQAYHKATAYFMGIINVQQHNIINVADDIYTALLKMSPNLCKLLIKILYDKFEPLRITTIKSLQFLIQTLSCSIGNFLPQMLKSILSTYPSKFQNNYSFTPLNAPITLNLNKIPQKIPQTALNMQNQKAVTDYYHHLLESYLNLLQNISREILRVIFQQVIIPNIFVQEISTELRIYLFRISQKIINQCEGDLDINPSFLLNLIQLIEGKGNLCNNNKSALFLNLKYHGQRLYQVVRNKLLINFDGNKSTKILQWIYQELFLLVETQVIQKNLFLLQKILQLVQTMYIKEKNIFISSPINFLLQFLNQSLVNQSLPFQKILSAIQKVLKFLYITNNNGQQLSKQIIYKIFQRAKINSLSIKQLKILQNSLNIINIAELEWLQIFINCIPHSTHDQTFEIFNTITALLKNQFNQSLIIKCLKSLLDLYTVKGKAHKKSKNNFIKLLIFQSNKRTEYFQIMLNFLLIENRQPEYQPNKILYEPNKLLTKLKNRQRKFDSKVYYRNYQLFIEKLTLVTQLLEQLNKELFVCIFDAIESNTLISAIKYLFSSVNSKVRLKALNLINIIYNNYCIEYDLSQVRYETLIISKLILSIKNQSSVLKESKIVYNAFILIEHVFNNLLIFNYSQSNQQKKQKQKDLDLELVTRESKIGHQQIGIIRSRQILKVFPLIISNLTSPYNNIKQIIYRVIKSFFKADILKYKTKYMNKILQFLNPILKSLLISNDSGQRAGGLLVVGALSGFLLNFQTKIECLQYYKQTYFYTKQFIQQVFNLQKDWEQNNQKYSKAIIQLVMPKQKAIQLCKKQNQRIANSTYANISESMLFSFNIEELYPDNKRIEQQNDTINNLSTNIVQFLNQNQEEVENKEIQQEIMIIGSQSSFSQALKIDIENYFWLEKLSKNQIDECLQIFRKQTVHLVWDEKIQNNQLYTQLKQKQFCIYSDYDQLDKNQKFDKDQEQLDFQDLGIIEVDQSQEWNDYQDQVKNIQKPHFHNKRMKLSPNIRNSSKQQYQNCLYRNKQIKINQNDSQKQLIYYVQDNNCVDQDQNNIDIIKEGILYDENIKNEQKIQMNVTPEQNDIEKVMDQKKVKHKGVKKKKKMSSNCSIKQHKYKQNKKQK